MPLHDIAELIPETRGTTHEQPTNRPTNRGAHYAIPFRDIAFSTIKSLDIDLGACTWLRVVSPYGLDVFVDGELVWSGTELKPIPLTLPGGHQSGFNPEVDNAAGGLFDSTGLKRYRLSPGFDFTMEAPAHRLTLIATGPAAAFNQWSQVGCPGTVHVFVGAGKVKNVDFGTPIAHSMVLELLDESGLGVDWFLRDIRLCLHGNDTGAGQAGAELFVPTRSQLIGVGVRVDSGGAGFVATDVVLTQQAGAGVDFLIGAWSPLANRTDLDLSAMDISIMESRTITAGTTDGCLTFNVATSGISDAVRVYTRWRSWM